MESKLAFDFKTNQQILKKVAFIDSFKGKWTGLEVKESIYLKELKQIATIERPNFDPQCTSLGLFIIANNQAAFFKSLLVFPPKAISVLEKSGSKVESDIWFTKEFILILSMKMLLLFFYLIQLINRLISS